MNHAFLWLIFAGIYAVAETIRRIRRPGPWWRFTDEEKQERRRRYERTRGPRDRLGWGLLATMVALFVAILIDVAVRRT